MTLFCDVESGNPNSLLRVQWFMDDLFLDELPQCTKTDESVEGRLDLCDVDPREDENNKSHLKSLKNKHKIETISNFPTSHSY